jgi:hypothetical protein
MRALALGIALAWIAGCAGTDSASRWVDQTIYGTQAVGPASTAYAGAARVKVYGAPEAGAAVEGVLNLHEKVARFQSERGFAYVEAEGNVKGWVREDQLVAARPRAQKPATPEPAQPAATAEPSAEPAPAPEEEPAPAPDAEPSEPERSVFDPY